MILTAMLAGAAPIVAYAVGRRRGFDRGARWGSEKTAKGIVQGMRNREHARG